VEVLIGMLVLGLVLLALTGPVLALLAFTRTSTLRGQVGGLTAQVAALEARVSALVKLGQAGRPAPADTAIPAPTPEPPVARVEPAPAPAAPAPAPVAAPAAAPSPQRHLIRVRTDGDHECLGDRGRVERGPRRAGIEHATFHQASPLRWSSLPTAKQTLCQVRGC